MFQIIPHPPKFFPIPLFIYQIYFNFILNFIAHVLTLFCTCLFYVFRRLCYRAGECLFAVKSILNLKPIFIMYYLILAVISIIVIVVAIKSSMLRNVVFNNDNFGMLAETDGKTKPRAAFSLGRSQLAFWTVIIISSFIYVYLNASPQEYAAPVLAVVNLTLLGIAAGTTIASKVIDNSQKDTQGTSIPQQDYPSEGFLIDIISDEKGVSIYRLQSVIWTLIIGAIYIAYVSGKSKMPDDTVITSQLLILMGISSSTYVGLKTTENTSAPVSPATTNLVPPTGGGK